MADYSGEINLDYHANTQDLQSSMVSDILGGATATVVDAGASIWNSLPGTTEVDTADLLGRVSDNALRVYEENPDLIHAASFIGSSFIPGGLALKGMNAMRNGSKAVNWFTKLGKEADMAKVGQMFKEGAAGTKEYRSAVRGMYAKTALNQALDAAAMEVAIVGTLNAAPMVEDYMKDPLTNFGLSVAFGGVLGGAIGTVADHFAVRAMTGGIMGEALENTLMKAKPIMPDMTNSVALQTSYANIGAYDAIVEAGKLAGKTANNDITISLAAKLRIIETASADARFESMLSPGLKELGLDSKEHIKKIMMGSPEMFGVESLSAVAPSELKAAGVIKAPKISLDTAPSLTQVNAKDPEVIDSVKSVYFPELGLYGTVKDLKHYAGASALNKTPEELAKGLGKQFGKVANYDASFELMSTSAAELQGNYIAYMKRVEGMSKKDLEKLEVSPSDSGMLTALISRMKADPELAEFGVKIGTGEAYTQAILKEADSALMAKTTVTTETAFGGSATTGLPKVNAANIMKRDSAALGVEGSYQKAVDQFTRPSAMAALDPRKYGAGVDDDVSQMIMGWIRGNKGYVDQLRRGAFEFSKGGHYASGLDDLAGAAAKVSKYKAQGALGTHVDAGTITAKDIARADAYEAGQAFSQMYNSEGSQQLRSHFQSVADADGNVLLFRGALAAGREPGHNTVRSYTTDISKAREFGNVTMYKVHVDDIAAGFLDTAGDDIKNEILVIEGARHGEATLSTEGKVAFMKEQEARVVTTTTTTTEPIAGGMVSGPKTAKLKDLENMLLQAKKDDIDGLLAQGIPLDSIAIKTNTSKALVEEYALSADKSIESLDGMIWDSMSRGGNTFGNVLNSPEDIEKILNPINQPLVLKGNQRKNQYADAYAGLDNRAMTTINGEVTASILYGSKNPAAAQLASYLFNPGNEAGSTRYILDMIKSSLSKANNELAGSAFINSSDFYARNMGDLGPMMSAVGKQVQHVANNYIESVNKPMAEAMSRISANAAETVEFNTFREVNAGLAGWRQFDPSTGQIMQKVEKIGEDGNKVTILEAAKYQGKDYTVVSKSVIDAVSMMQAKSPELLALVNTNRKIQGIQNVADIGLWIPSFNPVNKLVAYVHNLDTDVTQILWANTAEEYAQVVRGYKQKLVANGQDKSIKVYEKGVEQAEWSRMNGRLDTMNMTVADSSAKKSGSSASALVRSDNQVFGEIAGGYEHFINSQIRTMADLSMSDITGTLDKMSAITKGSIDSQPLTGIKKFLETPSDSAAIMKNTLLGGSNLGEYGGWASLNQSFETGLAYGSRAVSKLWDTAVTPLTKGFLGGKKKLDSTLLAKMDYEKLATEMEAKGIVNPWAGYDKEAASMFGLSRLEDSPDTSKRIVYASNALAATVALRIGELAQPLVNMMSLPILTGLAIANKMPETFMGIQKGTAKVSGPQIIMEGARAANSPAFAALGRKWEALGYFTPMISEANQTLKAARSMNAGAIATVEKALDSRFVEIMSKPADWSEGFVRRQTMFTGAVLAKRLYPGLGDDAITIFARDFMDKAVGNFHASQRPVFFQGTLGVALGLFQTYSLTLGQNIYRHLELKNYKTLGKAALMQSGIFGTGSLPGFNAVSQAIGEHFSDDHVDLVTGTYRALPDEMANTILFGLPSIAGTGLHTRGDSNFRVPGLSGDNVVAINFAKQMAQAVGSVANSLDNSPGQVGQAFMQALSLQNMSRPLARTAELATGYSVTKAGNTVQVPEEVWTTTGVMARVLGTRPLEEVKLRETMHLNTFYGSIDRQNRQGLTDKLKTGIRNGTLSDTDVESFAHEYTRNGGSPAGWRSAYKTALGQESTSGKEAFVDKLKPNSPFMFMMDNLER